VGGYISNVAQWTIFNREWKKVLDEFGVSQMHRAALETWNEEFKQSNGWNPAKRKAFLQKLHAIIRRRTKIAIGASVIKKDWEEVMPNHLKKQYGGIYGWCAQSCIVQARVWCEKPQRQFTDPLQFIFEAGTTGEGQVAEMFRSLYKDPLTRKGFRIGGWGFQSKDVMPLQAADVLAYELFKQTENQIIDGGISRPIRASLSSLMREEDCIHPEYWDKKKLLDWLEIWKEGRVKTEEVSSASLSSASDNRLTSSP
jgi:hypothetical protein